MTDQPPLKAAMLGLGTMGAGMARNLLAAGFDLAVYNRNPARAAPFADSGARIAASPAEAAAGAGFVVAMVADDTASRGVWLGDDGALAGMPEGAVAIESSTITADWARELAGHAAARGVTFVDAPVTGSKAAAEGGTLRFLAGGDADSIDRARPALEAMSNDIMTIGPVGSGAMIKLINNFMCGVQVASLAEALAMAERSGLDIERALPVLTEGAPGSPLIKMISKRMEAHDYALNFSLELMAKDLRYASSTFAAAGIDLPSAAAAIDRFTTAAESGPGGDMSSVIEPLRKGGR